MVSKLTFRWYLVTFEGFNGTNVVTCKLKFGTDFVDGGNMVGDQSCAEYATSMAAILGWERAVDARHLYTVTRLQFIHWFNTIETM